MKLSWGKLALVFVWMAMLHWVAYAAEPKSPFDRERQKAMAQLVDLNLSAFIDAPIVHIPAVYMQEHDFTAEVKGDPQFKKLEQVISFREDGDIDRALREIDKYLDQYRNTPVAEYLLFLKGDCLFQRESASEDPKISIALEAYLDAMRYYPLHAEIPRALYQVGLAQLELGFYPDVAATIGRAIKDFGSREFAPDYHLILAEQYFRKNENQKALVEYTFVIQNYPKGHAAVDSAFRKAFILFRQGDFKGAFQAYATLEKFHTDEIDKLKLENDVNNLDRYVDRIFYAETIYLNGKLADAAKLFQDLGNIFSTHPASAFVMYRLGDTYLHRGQVKAAEELYKFVLDRHKEQPLVVAVGRTRLADLYFLTKDRKVAKFNEKYLQEAFEQSRVAENELVAASSLAKLALHYLTFEIYPRAQATLKQYRVLFKDTPNQEWAEKKYIETVELEIQDYYEHEDFTAALATFLAHERDRVINFTDTRVLLNLAEAAKKMTLVDKSIQILNRVIYLEKSSEGRQEALLRLIDLLIAQGEFRKASERLRRFNFAYPTSALKYLYELEWGNLYIGMKNSQQAAYHFERAIEATKKLPKAEFEIRHVYMRVGAIYEELVLTDKAIDAYERYIAIMKEWTENKIAPVSATQKDVYLLKIAHQKVADMHYSLHDYPRAIDAYRTVAERVTEEPFRSHALYRIGECYLALNDRPLAIESFKKVTSDDASNIWLRAAKSYIASVELEVKYGIRIFN